MALTLSTAARNAACNAEVDLVDAGAGAGHVVIQTSGDAELADVTLDDPAFGAAATGVATAGGLPLDFTASGDGVAAKYRVYDSDDNEIWRGTCSASGGGGDMILNNTTLATGQDGQITAWTHTVPAS